MKDVHRLDRLGVRLVDSTSRGVLVNPSSESSLVVLVKKGQQLYLMLIELEDSVLLNMNESFDFGGDNVLRYQDKLCVPDVDDLQTRIFVQAHGSKYSIHIGSTEMYPDLKQIY